MRPVSIESTLLLLLSSFIELPRFESDYQSLLKNQVNVGWKKASSNSRAREILKSLQKVHPVFMQDLFYRRKWLLTRTPHMVHVNAPKTAKCSN